MQCRRGAVGGSERGQEANLKKNNNKKNPHNVLCVRSEEPRKKTLATWHASSAHSVSTSPLGGKRIKIKKIHFWTEAWRKRRPESEPSAQCDIQANTSTEHSRRSVATTSSGTMRSGRVSMQRGTPARRTVLFFSPKKMSAGNCARSSGGTSR